jgi:hypothetical protein
VSRPQSHYKIWFWIISLSLGILPFIQSQIVDSSSLDFAIAAGEIVFMGRSVRGAATDRRRSNYLRAPRIDMSVPAAAMDGDTVTFAVSTIGGKAVSYLWSFETKSGSKDGAHLKIENAAGPATPAMAFWYSTGHDICGIDFASTYRIKVRVTFDDGEQVTKAASFVVRVDKNWGGNVDPPAVRGAPEIRFDEKLKRWFITGSGTLKRVPNPLKMRIPRTSQFYEKVMKHEQVHVKQFENGILSDLFRVDSLMKWLQKANLSDTERQPLEQKIFAEISNWKQGQQQAMMKRLPAAEREAYAVSDQIAPRYIFQNCGRY